MFGGSFFGGLGKIFLGGEAVKFGIISQRFPFKLLKIENFGENFKKQQIFREIFHFLHGELEKDEYLYTLIVDFNNFSKSSITKCKF